MQDIILYGSGGMASEVVALIEDINRVEPSWSIKGYLDDLYGNKGDVVNGYPILGKGNEVLSKLNNPVCVVLAMSNPNVKENILQNINRYPLQFPVLIHPTAKVASSAKIGEGSIIGIDCIVSIKANIGKHVFLNMKTVIGHGSTIGDYTSCLVNCTVAGDVEIKDLVLLGSGSIIMEKKKIGRNAKVSMGSVVTTDVEENHVVLSRPSKSMYFGD